MTVTELNEFVRFYLGGLSVGVLDDLTLNQIIQNVLDSGVATTDCQEKYYSTLETLRWLERRQLQEKGSSGATGELVESKEKEGNVEITNKYSSSTTGDGTSWSTLIDNLVTDPTTIGCNPFPSTDGADTGNVIIGGADINGYERVYETRKARSAAAYSARLSGNYPWRP